MVGTMTTIEEYCRAQAARAAVQYLLDRLAAASVIERRGLEFGRRKAEEVLCGGTTRGGAGVDANDRAVRKRLP